MDGFHLFLCPFVLSSWQALLIFAMVKCCVAHGKSKFLLWQDRQIPFLPLQFRAFWDVKRTILRSTCSLGWNRDRRSWGHSDSGSPPLQKTSLCLVSFHGGPSRNLPGGSAGGHGQRTQTSQPSRTRGFHAASGRRACGALNKGLETCLQRPLPQLPVEKRDEFLALQKGCGTWLSLQHAQSRAGLSPTALCSSPPRTVPEGDWWGPCTQWPPAASPPSEPAANTVYQDAHGKHQTGSPRTLLFVRLSTFLPLCQKQSTFPISTVSLLAKQTEYVLK